ncbi:dihydroorotase [Jiulongibacter sediminis]|uniref:Dihydroorotase n=1 Tax=Jiulongibacter sediminis TaxID=1605367 RepID=A0A0P7BZS4_9BACT|nr:dihydroorotase [Jiulongibacter sediminis]KPM49917.1 dihydroorotase [Jiulongibacter sediminis]TBX26953.1 dihydroorotase [Jiulongibacter sediminis]
MKVLIKKAKIISTGSPHHLKQRDILVIDGVITKIGKIDEAADQIIKGKELYVSTGFMDLRTFSKEPGQEAMETLESLSRAAAKGGYSDLLIMPNTDPVIQSKGVINYLKNSSKITQVNFHAAAAVTLDNKGESFTEMWDLHEAGALAFTDGLKPLWNSDILYKSLQYLYPKKALLMNRPEEPALAMFGQMHEGITSTHMGTKGIPSEAEEIMIMRDLKLLEYADFESERPLLHFSCVSTASGLARIRKAKQKGLPVSCDIAAHQLAFTDEDLGGFDTNLKVSPPFRSKKDIKALQKGLEDGTIDAIVSDHNPLDEEHKNMEFDLAEFGVIGLQTSFAAALTYSGLPVENLIPLFTESPRALLQMSQPVINENEEANLTVIDAAQNFIFTEDMIESKSKNSPFIGKELKGKILATLNKGMHSA